MNHFLVFGTHPRLSLAEFCALKPDLAAPTLIGSAALIEDVDWRGDQLMQRLGGTVKLGDLLGCIPLQEVSAHRIIELLADHVPQQAFDFGWTVYGGSRQAEMRHARMALQLKKEFKARGLASRWVTSKDSGTISPAAIAKLKLTTQGLDINMFIVGEQMWLGLTTQVQDADAWSERDYGRPARDELVGMLPPKLARMMVNLAQASDGGALLDPFCGGGTVLMEAALLDSPPSGGGARGGAVPSTGLLIGSDIDATQISNAKKNLDWLVAQIILKSEDKKRTRFIQSDARDIQTALSSMTIDTVVTEGTLGPPLSGHETLATLQKNVRDISKLWLDTLKALQPLLAKQARLVVIWPAFKSSHGIARVELDQEVEQLGYHIINPLEGWDASNSPLLYMRPEQRVMRRIVVLRVK